MRKKGTKPYVYALIDPRNGLPFYIGKGRSSRRKEHQWKSNAGNHPNKKIQDRINELKALGLAHVVEVLFSSDDNGECCDKEEFYIAFYGRQNLFNLTDGGRRNRGAVRSQETRDKMALCKIGASNPNFGKPGTRLGAETSKETRAKISASRKGKSYRLRRAFREISAGGQPCLNVG